jgi:hypothetical protein
MILICEKQDPEWWQQRPLGQGTIKAVTQTNIIV